MSDLPPRWRLLAYWLVGLYAAWLAVGVFPAGPVEGDEQGVINGATAMARGEIDYLDLAYSPAIQPGSYAVLAAASRWTGLPVQTLFAVGTVGGALLFAWFASRLLAVTLALPGWVALAGLLWCQEVSSAAYYMNTVALGMWLTFLALWLACRPPDWRTATAMAACIAVAGWIRVDCLLPTPALPLLLWGATRNPRLALGVTVLVAAGSLLLVGALYHACGVSWGDLASLYANRDIPLGWWTTLRSMPQLLSPLLCVLLVIGLSLMIVRREWRLLALAVAGCAATLPVYGNSLCSPKYFYHLVPFFLLAVFYAGISMCDRLRSAGRPWRVGGAAALALLAVAEQTIGLQTSSDQFRGITPAPVLATLAILPGPQRPIRVVLGPGEMIGTADGFRVRTGPFFAPWAWHREKTAMNAQLARFARLLAATPEVTLYYSDWLSYQMSVRVLRGEGYALKGAIAATSPMPYSGEWVRPGHRVRTGFLAYQASLFFDPARHPANATGEDTFFIGYHNALQPITELADGGHWEPLWAGDRWRFVTFSQRRLPPAPL